MQCVNTAYKNNFAMKKYLVLPALLIGNALFAQIPEDVLRYSFFPQNGTARVVAIGGAMGSLGGDITANFVNPGGLGNYKTGEFVYSPGLYFNNNNVNFRDTKVNSKDNNFAFLGGPIGFVYGAADPYKKGSSHAISLAVNQTTNYNNRVQYSGYNNYSSFSEQFAEKGVQALNINGTIDNVLNDPRYAYDASPAFDTYLIDTFSGNSVKAMPEFVLAQGKALYQQSTIETSGGIYEVALGYAMNKNDKFMFGGSLGIPILSYKSNTVFYESDTSADHANNFSDFTYNDNFSSNGVGVNLKVGAIYKPSEYLRLGLAIHTPSYMFTVKDKREVNMDVNSENYKGARSVSSTRFTNGVPGQSEYTVSTPWKMMISGSYVIREIEDVEKQKGFITADIEYVGYKGSSFYSANENPETSEIDYYKLLNQVIKDEYKGALNFRVGGELKFNVIMGRLGFAYYSNPYQSLDFKASKMLLSGGLGYRNKGFFVDLTYVYSINKDVNFPYRLGDKANTFANINNQLSNIVASVGVKF